MPVSGEFDLRALYDALDHRRRERHLTWSGVAAEMNSRRTFRRPIATSTMTGLKTKDRAEGDGVLQMLVWLGRTPESFVEQKADADAARYQLPELASGQILRWDTQALYGALNGRRSQRGLTWTDVANELPGFTASMLTTLAKGPRIGFPRVMRLVAWFNEPAVTFMRIDSW